jgi:hypothetical protein
MDEIFQRKFEALSGVRDEFYLRYYAWALADATREVESDFAFIRKVRSEIAEHFLSFTDSLNRDEQRALLNARVKRAHSRGVELSGDSLSDAEVLLDQESHRFMQWKIAESPEHLLQRPRVPKKLIRKALREGLANRDLGSFEGCDMPSEWKYLQSRGNWTLETCIDVGGKSKQFAYYHRITAFEEIPLNEYWISCMSWLGIGSSDWTLVRTEELGSAVADVDELAQHFLKAAPILLQSISPMAGTK